MRDDVESWRHQRLRGALISRYASPLLENLLAHPDASFEEPGAQLIKKDVKTTLAATSFDGARYVIKRYNCTSPLHRLRLAVSTSRAEHSFWAAQQFTRIGIVTPLPVAWAQESYRGLRGRSWFVYEHTGDAIRADDLSDESDSEQIDQLLGTMIRNLVQMREHGFSHGDMKPPNYLITPTGAVMIDLDGVRQHKHAGACQQALARDVARWTRWWDENDPQPKISKKSKDLLQAAGFAID